MRFARCCFDMAPNKQDISRSSPTILGGLFSEQTFHQAKLSNPTKYLRWHDNGINEGEYLCIEKHGTNLGKYLCLWGLEEQRQFKAGFKVVYINAYSQHKITTDLKTFMTSWLLPEGYPDSVASSYGSYMQWRALQHFFGGVISVFTTHSLLHALGVSSKGSTSLAINWVIKDGAGRIGKLLYARKGKKFDCNLKQLRFTGHILMEVGALVELATSIAPSLFLPLACAANVVKNIAAVSSTSTRAPIYKAFALKENIGDITAKGESTSNIADLLGTGLGILISGNSKQILPTFILLSCGYVFSSYQEVKAVILPTMNQERFGVSVQHFLNTGQVPSVYEANSKECIFTFPWPRQMDVELGARVADAFQNSREFLSAKAMFKDKNYLITFNRRRKRAYVVLKEAATSEDVMEGAFQAYMLLHILDRASQKSCKRSTIENIFDNTLCAMDAELLAEGAIGSAIFSSCKNSSAHYKIFKEKAAIQGWIVRDSLLNPGGVRLEIS
ncbi:hypothetical protein SUGI_1031380 [Cryptomeria japonica]|uniref:protein root UVB sensitive 6 n=1 Tax=Cryptomeria japonica TaxID=3369 RepID=UPI002414A603|nr:protein root UVB sensitive 6 [Cryptomeria japonica]GLJ48897.1 hypothetical protein SUGI_1031380 [Cryptomeria japonica]